MRFVCDSCRAQYMISDDKVGAKGVKVRCKKCGYNIVVRPAGAAPAKDEVPNGASANEEAARAQEQPREGSFGLPASVGTPPEGGLLGGVEDDEIGAVFDQVLNSGSNKLPAEEGSAKASEAGADAEETIRVPVEVVAGEMAGKPAAAAHDWFIAIRDKQVGPLSLEQVRDHWERGEVGPDNLCWRSGFSDWIPLSDAAELVSVLAPRPAKPVIVAPAGVSGASGESAFSAGGSTKAGRTDGAAKAGAPGAEAASGWKPSAASVLASLVKEENETLSKPAPKPAAAEWKPTAGGLLDVPPPDAGVAGPQGGLPLPESPMPTAPYLPQPQGYAPPSAQGYAPPPPGYVPPPQAYPPAAYPGYPPPNRSKTGLFVGIAAAVVLVAGGAVAFLVTRTPAPASSEGSPTPAAAGQAGTTAPKPAEPSTPPSTATAQDTASAPAAPQPNAEAPSPGAAAPTQNGAATANPSTPTPAEPAKAAEPAKTEQAVARVDSPDSSKSPRQRPSRTAEREASQPSSPKQRSATPEDVEDKEFDELFGTKSKSSGGGSPERNNSSAPYIPPEPGSGGTVLERLGQSDIMAVVLANKPAIVQCVNEQKRQDPSLSGKLVMRWVIQTNGKTKNVSCQTAEFRSTHMASCISGLIKSWTFPKHKVQGDPIDFPFTF